MKSSTEPDVAQLIGVLASSSNSFLERTSTISIDNYDHSSSLNLHSFARETCNRNKVN